MPQAPQKEDICRVRKLSKANFDTFFTLFLDVIENAPEPILTSNGSGNIHHNNNGQVEMTTRQRREANLGIVLISISGINNILKSGLS